MKTRKLIWFFILLVNLVYKLYADENKYKAIEEMVVINVASNEDNSIMLINTCDFDNWQNRIYAVNPGNPKSHWYFKKIWDKNKISGTVRSLVYSPFSKKFYFYSAWGDEDENCGIYTIDTKNVKKADRLVPVHGEKYFGMGYFLVNKRGVWLLRDIDEPKGEYWWGHSELCQIEDENGPFQYNKVKKIIYIKGLSFDRAENAKEENEDKRPHPYDVSYIFQTTDNVLLIKDYDNSSWWTYNCVNGSSKKYNTYEEAKTEADNFEFEYASKIERKNRNIDLLIILIIVICFLIMAIVILLILTKKRNTRNKDYSVKEQNRKIFEIQEKERAKISRDIHDSVVQDIRVIRLETENLIVDENSKSKQTKIEDIATDCIIKLRNICYNLTPAELTIHNKGESSKLELISIINSLVQQFSSRTHFPCVFKVEEGFEYPVLEKETTQNLFRVIQEALTNIEKHSYATQASIFIKKEKNILFIYITDDGIGCNQEELQKKLEKKEHLGLRSMIDRMELIGGSVEFLTAQDDGMEVKISLPIENK